MEVRRFKGGEPPAPADPDVTELVEFASRPLDLDEPEPVDPVEVFLGELDAVDGWTPYRVFSDVGELVRVERDGRVVYASEANLVEAILVVSGWKRWAATPSTSSSSITPDAPS